jgi:hypothetical protein
LIHDVLRAGVDASPRRGVSGVVRLIGEFLPG